MTVNAAWNIWNFRRTLAAALLDDGHQVTILAPHDHTIGDLERMGCRVRPLQMSVKGLNPVADLMLLRRFKHILRQEKPDIVLSYTIKNNIFGAMAARGAGVSFVPNVTGLGTAFLSGGLMQAVAERLYRHAFRGLPVILFQNEDDRELFLNLGLVDARQAQLVPGSGIDLDRFAMTAYPAAGTRPVFLMIARLLRDKGVHEFVEAARMIRAQGIDARFQLLGATGSQNRTAIDAATVQGWVREGSVEYLGTTDDVRPSIAAANCVVLPSYREGAPRTLIEAAAMGRPLIASDVPGCRAVVDRDISGFFCDARDADSLAVAMGRFLDLPYGAQVEMGQASRAKMVREFDQQRVIDIYRGVIAQWDGTAKGR
ncbi:glycosyltransferase family 4 protein [Aquabacter cavernae]|uniref:glycosyltransferase family 4 protein n=1 Tax=Aquabacter cavernae TaxID=2496029 RepID=UPI000F8C687E|nr:glycosyltransferase family 4 protein [Aquabacter cavernae]